MDFHAKDALARVHQMSVDDLDALDFGVVAMRSDGIVTAYSKWESELSGLSPGKVVGKHFFTEVAPCTNNFMVAHRYETEMSMDVVVDYMFTVGMQPTMVRLRLLQDRAADQAAMLVRLRD